VAEPTIGRALAPLLELAGVPEESSLAVAVSIALVVATATQMVVGELVPKNLAIARPIDVAFRVVTPLRVINALFKPLIVFLNASANWTVRRLGIEPREELINVRSLQELESLIQSSREGGGLLEEEFALLERSISFRERTAADILVPRTDVVGIPRDARVSAVVHSSIETGHSRFPVYGDDLDDILGIVHVKDVLRIPVERRGVTPVQDLVREAFIVPESLPLEPLLIEMRREQQLLAVAVDEYGGTAGIVSVEDIIEEIVGEIEDEYDRRAPASARAQTVPSGVHVLNAKLHAREVEDACGFEMPEGPYDTLAGFLLSLFNDIPQPGDHASYDGWEFKVVQMEKRRISKVLVVAPSDRRGEAT
jgi:CBS domain containing-hemolysin-like protein